MKIKTYRTRVTEFSLLTLLAASVSSIGCGGVDQAIDNSAPNSSADQNVSAEVERPAENDDQRLMPPGTALGMTRSSLQEDAATAKPDEVSDLALVQPESGMNSEPAITFSLEENEKASSSTATPSGTADPFFFSDEKEGLPNALGGALPSEPLGRSSGLRELGGLGGGGEGRVSANGPGGGYGGPATGGRSVSTPKSKQQSSETQETAESLVESQPDRPEDQSPMVRERAAIGLQQKYRSLEEKITTARQRQQDAARFVTLQPGEELWVIAQSANSPAPAADDLPGSGCLMATLPNETKQIPVPLKHTDVVGHIDGYIASVNVTQQFHNPYDSKIEASYVFPLPQNAAVNEFVMTVGDRRIRGIIREKEKAKQIYEAAKAQGHVASLMTQQRPNIFTQKVANIEPGKQIDIEIRYFNTLRYDDGAYEFVFPMVVGPRFNPSPGEGIGAVARGDHGTSGQSTEVQYLAPDERSGHDISVTVNINAGLRIEDVNCLNHAIERKDSSPCDQIVTLAGRDRIPNKDFVLRYQVASDQIKTAMLTHEDANGQYFTMMLYPPKSLASVQRSPMEMVFVLDCSGSMRGAPMNQAKAAIRHALQSLTERDTFQIIQFSNNASQLGTEPVVATAENIQRGLTYLQSLSGTGGTQMIEGIKAALDFPHDEGRFRLVSFMTDGYIGNEQQILTTLHDKLGSSRIFSFGVGSSPNRFLMNRMASLGRGAVAYLSLNEDAVKVVNQFNAQISHPAMTDLTIDWGSMDVTDVYPSRLPDLIVGRPVVLTGRFMGEPGQVKVNGRVDMEPASFEVAMDERENVRKHEAIAAVWARLKIKDLMLQKVQVPAASADIENAVTETALAYNLMSSFTSFVAVDSMTKTEGEFGTTVAVPVSVPDGVRYDTTVGGQGSENRDR